MTAMHTPRLGRICVFAVALLCFISARADTHINFLGFHYRSESGQQPALELSITRTEPNLAGTWTANLVRSKPSRYEQRWYSLTVVDGNRQNTYGTTFNSTNFSFLFAGNKSWSGEQKIAIASGTLVLEGIILGKKASGAFTFTPDTDYAQKAGAHLRGAPSSLELFQLGLNNVSADEIVAFDKTGLELRAGDLIRLKNFGVTPQYALDVCKDQKFSAEEITKLKNFGVPEKFPSAVKSAGYDFDAERLIKLRNFGISAEDAVAWKQAGYNYDAEGLVKMRNFGVQPEYGKAVRGVFTNATSDELIKLRNFGLSKEFLNGVQKADVRFTVDEVVKLRNFGVTADYILAWREAGFSYTAEELIKLRNFGVPASYAAAANVPDRKPISAETLIKLRQRGLSADEIRELRQ